MTVTVREAFIKRPIRTTLTFILTSAVASFGGYQAGSLYNSYQAQRETDEIAQKCLDANKIYTKEDLKGGINFAGNECLVLSSVKIENQLAVAYVFPDNVLTYTEVTPHSKYYKNLSFLPGYEVEPSEIQDVEGIILERTDSEGLAYATQPLPIETVIGTSAVPLFLDYSVTVYGGYFSFEKKDTLDDFITILSD